MKQANLILHCGAAKIEREQLINVPTPAATASWCPIPHIRMVEQVETALATTGMRTINQCHSVTKEGNRYFGLLQVVNEQSNNDEYGYVLGIRNSHDKSFPASLCIGAQVFICDNLSFSGEIRIDRKHTSRIMRDLPRLTSRAIGLLAEKWTLMGDRIARYKQIELNDKDVNDFLVRSVEAGVMPITQLPAVLNEWRKPSHEEFAPRNAWSLFNAFTECGKEDSLAVRPKRMINLHGLMDAQAGFFGSTAVIDVETTPGSNN